MIWRLVPIMMRLWSASSATCSKKIFSVNSEVRKRQWNSTLNLMKSSTPFSPRTQKCQPKPAHKPTLATTIASMVFSMNSQMAMSRLNCRKWKGNWPSHPWRSTPWNFNYLICFQLKTPRFKRKLLWTSFMQTLMRLCRRVILWMKLMRILVKARNWVSFD